ncbi:OLC1v1011171C1 [Oldenlandia corymbosa var. corymbosa]|uniref:Epidermal patterning factor-like protein n=1 Tax=Oldenlandia corymbosa var. corymbosa TaxID=529605 RepID=A0AAV1DSY7_OLDCO|nr:OLC1v1011171C1 [Oldenlandia corymbosa var. corymbosa]
MGNRQNHLTCSMFHHFHISFLLLLVLCTSHLRFNAQGRPIAKTIGNYSKIGSRPPRCDRRCNNCGHCEAIQVPTNPQIKDGHKNLRNSSAVSTITYAGGGGSDYSNYKPMSWKCKCGDLIFNP